jgi:hypothetical protein
MDVNFLPEELRPENLVHPSAGDTYPVVRKNPITGYETYLIGSGDPDVLGWLRLNNGNRPAGFIYIGRPARPAALGSDYVIMHILPEQLDVVIQILRSGEPLEISYLKGSADVDAYAFLGHRN